MNKLRGTIYPFAKEKNNPVEYTRTSAFCNIVCLCTQTFCKVGRFAFGLVLYADSILHEHTLQTQGIMPSFLVTINSEAWCIIVR